MTIHQDLLRPPRKDCALCSLPEALPPWPVFWEGRENWVAFLEAGEDSIPLLVRKQQGLLGHLA